ncbi:MAG: hypothetical protein L0G23_04015 [Ruaniaceae bacterium]|nr:hypothetical protein [Ruaniaceae bacterium]
MKRALAVCASLIVLVAAPALAAPTSPGTEEATTAELQATPVGQPKEEIVYAHLEADGEVNRVFVVNSFRETSGQILDFGEYLDVVNLTNSDAISHDGDRVEVTTAPGDFHYQGESASLAMPWLIDIDYILDGAPVSTDELRGASGDLAIHVRVRANDAVDPVFFDNYMLQTSVNLPSEYFGSIVSEGATIAASGTTWVVNLTSMPGSASEFVITTAVTNAHLGQIQIAGLPFQMAMDLPDPAEYLGELVALQEAIALLADGVGQFTSGVGQLDGASGQLGSGASQLATNARVISQGFDRLAAGRAEFDSGLREYNQGVQEFSSGISELTAGLGALTEGIGTLADGSSQLAGGLSTYSTGMDQFSGGLTQASQGSQALSAGVAELSGGLQQLTEDGKYADPNLVDSSAQILEALEMLDASLSFPLTEEELDLLLDLLQTLANSLDEIAGTIDETDFESFMGILRDALSEFDDSVAEIERLSALLQDSDAVTAHLGIDVTGNQEAQALLAYMAEQGRLLDEESSQLRAVRESLNGLDPLIDGLLTALEQLGDEFDTVRDLIHRLNESVQGITIEDLRELAAGLGLLSSSYREFHEGLVAYVDGVEQASIGVSGDPGLLSGAQELSDGLGTLATSGAELAQGSSELAAGASELSDGIGALRDGVEEFSSQGGLIVEGAGQLAEGGDALVSGHGQLLSGDAQLGSGVRQFVAGMGVYADGAQEFSRGLGALAAGGDALRGGANTLRDETSDMDQQMTDQMDEALSEFMPSEFDLVSFTDPRNTGIELVQFVYLADAQSEPAAVPAQPDDDSDTSLWDRILDIFR